MYGPVKVVKWKIYLGETVVGEVPSQELAIQRARNQAKNLKLEYFTLIDTEANTNQKIYLEE